MSCGRGGESRFLALLAAIAAAKGFGMTSQGLSPGGVMLPACGGGVGFGGGRGFRWGRIWLG